MKVKCYGLFDGDRGLILEFANPSQKDFLDYELKTALKRLKKSTKIQYQNTANGVWYCRINPNDSITTQIILLSRDCSSVAYAANFLNQASQLQKPYNLSFDRQKIKSKIVDLIKLYNANKMDKLNSNVMELQTIMKGNVSKMVQNMNQLETAERKSDMMAELSMQFERDSKQLEKKMKRRKLMMKLLIIGIVGLILSVVSYILFF